MKLQWAEVKWCHFLSSTMPGQTTFSTKFGFLIAKNHLDIELLLVFSDDSAYFLILRNVRQVTRQAIQNQNSVHSKTSTRYNIIELTCVKAAIEVSPSICCIARRRPPTGGWDNRRRGCSCKRLLSFCKSKWERKASLDMISAEKCVFEGILQQIRIEKA